MVKKFLRNMNKLKRLRYATNYTTTALKNRSYGVMNTNLRFFINMRGGGWERDTTVSVHSHV